MNREKVNAFFARLPKNLIILLMVIIWIVPTLGLLITSLRPLQSIQSSGWWTIFDAPAGSKEYNDNCASCHGGDGKLIASADLTNPELVARFDRSARLLVDLKAEYNGQPHIGTQELPSSQTAATIVVHLKNISGLEKTPRFTLDNYVDALMGYRGTRTYAADCADGTPPVDINCNLSDLLNPRGMGRAFLNSLIVTIPATFLPIFFAALAGYAFAWLDFKGRMLLFAILVGLQVVPLQMTMVPISRVYATLGLNGTFLGVWLFHTGFGMPYAIYLMRNFLGTLPRDLFESAYLDGASHWTAFYKLAIPLALPAIASLGIFQFLWVWNDLLVSLVFLGSARAVVTYQIANMVTSMGAGWHLLTAAAFLSMLLPMVVFFALQRYFVRGMLAGAVKG
jgi:alpha-glucoside transport system permease protein